MSPVEISVLPKATRDKMFREAVAYAIGQSIEHSNSEVAKSLLKCVSLVSKKAGAKEALIKFFETWGNLHHNKAHDELRHTKRHKPETWCPEYEKKLNNLNWADAIEDTRPKQTIYDADDEFRVVLRRLKKISEDPEKTLLHSVLLTKIEEAIYAYGRSDAKVEEERRGQALFDKSTQMSSLRAGKFAKGC